MVDQVAHRHHRIDRRQFIRAGRWPVFPLHFGETPSIGGHCNLHVREFGNVIGDRIFETQYTVFHQVKDRRDSDDLAHGPDADPRLPIDFGVRQEIPIDCAVLVDDVAVQIFKSRVNEGIMALVHEPIENRVHGIGIGNVDGGRGLAR